MPPAETIPEPSAAPTQAMNDAYVRVEREICETLYGDFQQADRRQFDLLTIAGQASYPCPPEVTSIGELWISDFHRYLLHQVHPDAFVQDISDVRARPIHFCFFNEHLRLNPTPDREYHIAFIQREQIDRGPNYDELSRITREAFLPRMMQNHFMDYGGGFNLLSNACSEREAANKKSIDLMKNWLTPKQLEEYQQTSAFEVIGNHTGTHYHIHNASPYNVVELDRGVRRRRLCFVPDNANALGDVMLAQKIMLETNERHALEVANHQSA